MALQLMLKTIQMILSLSPVRNLPPSGDQKRNFYFRIFLSNSVVLFFRRTRQIPSALCAANAVHFFLLGRFKTLSQVIFPAVFASVLARNFKYKRTQARARAKYFPSPPSASFLPSLPRTQLQTGQ